MNAPLFIAINAASGADTNDMPATIATALREAGHEVTLFEIPKGALLADVCKPLIEQAVAAKGIVVAAGGDGTVNGIAKLCYQYHVPMAVIPLGTFNYFARGLGISLVLEEAIATISNGLLQDVSAGFVHEHLFLNNASFGLYPKLIKRREAATAKFGRKRIIGALSALQSLLAKQKCFSIKFHIAGKIEHYRTTMVFIGNNSFQLETLGLDVSSCTRENRLAVAILRPLTHWQLARLVWRGIVKNLHFENKLQQFCADTFEVETKRASIEVVIDGEIVRCATPLKFTVEANALRVMVPRQETA